MPTSSIVLITGANQGIGFEIAKKLGTEHPDYHIIVGGRKEGAVHEAVAKLTQLGVSAESLVIDVTSDESVFNAANAVAQSHGHLDVLINNAGISVFEASQVRDQWKGIFETNVFGVYSVTEAFIPLLERSQTTKRIVNLTSKLGSSTLKADPSEHAHQANDFIIYSSSKAALNMATQHYAIRFEKDPSWKVNLSCPGHCATNLNNFAGQDDPALGALNACRLATLGPDGETGTFSDRHGPVPW